MIRMTTCVNYDLCWCRCNVKRERGGSSGSLKTHSTVPEKGGSRESLQRDCVFSWLSPPLQTIFYRMPVIQTDTKTGKPVPFISESLNVNLFHIILNWIFGDSLRTMNKRPYSHMRTFSIHLFQWERNLYPKHTPWFYGVKTSNSQASMPLKYIKTGAISSALLCALSFSRFLSVS